MKQRPTMPSPRPRRPSRAPDIDAIKAAGEKLQEAGHKLAEVVYSSAQELTLARLALQGRVQRPALTTWSMPTTRSSTTIKNNQ